MEQPAAVLTGYACLIKWYKLILIAARLDADSGMVTITAVVVMYAASLTA